MTSYELRIAEAVLFGYAIANGKHAGGVPAWKSWRGELREAYKAISGKKSPDVALAAYFRHAFKADDPMHTLVALVKREHDVLDQIDARKKIKEALAGANQEQLARALKALTEETEK